MSGVLHPVGPEPERVYWIRRGVIVLALVALVSLVLVLVSALGGGSGPTAVPSSATPQPTTTPSTSASPAPSPSAAASTPAATPASPTSPAPSASVTPSASATPQPVAACDAAKLRPTLRGAQKVASGQPVTFALSFINGSKVSCTLAFDRRSYELKVFSATTRVWTTKNCSTAVKPVRVLLTPEKAYEFSLVWSGLRSKDDCKNRKAKLSAGTYYVTSQLQGAEPVQLPVRLT